MMSSNQKYLERKCLQDHFANGYRQNLLILSCLQGYNNLFLLPVDFL